MKLKSLFAVTLATVTLLSCTKEIIVEKTIPQEEGTAKIKLSVDAGIITKAANHAGSELSSEEKEIYNYAVLIFNSSRMLERIISESPYSPPNGRDNPVDYSSPLTFTGDDNSGEITITAGLKYFFVIANAPETLLSEQNGLEGQTISDLSWTLTLDDAVNYIKLIIGPKSADPADPNRGFLMTSKKIEVQNIPAQDESDTAIPIRLEIGRGMAKVSLASNLEEGTPAEQESKQPNGTLTDIKYKIANNPMDMNIIPDVSSYGVYTTPYYYDEHVRSTYFTYPENYIDASTAGNLSVTYCVENANLVPKEGNSTVAYIQGVYTPRVLYDKDNSQSHNGDFVTGTTFWRIYEIVDGAIAYNEKYYSEDPTGGSATAGGEHVVKYENGVTYYPLWLYNERNTMAPYTVARNSYYQIDIDKVQDAGENDEDKLVPDKEIPLDGQADIEVTIKVLEWDEVPQSGVL